MAEYYRTVFTIDREERRGLDLLGEVEGVLRDWTEERFGELGGGGYGEWRNENETLRLAGGQVDESGFFSLTSELQLGWTLDFRLATKGERVEVDVQMRGDADDAVSAGNNFHAGPPKILPTLVERFECSFEGEALTTEPVQVTEETAHSFVQDDLFNPNRKLPIVVVSPTHSGNPLVRPSFLQSRLLGLANVFAYDNDTEKVVSEKLGHLACYWGAIRVYWPGCFAESNSWEHPYWKEDRVQKSAHKIWLELRDPCLSYMSLRLGLRMYPEVAGLVRRNERENLAAQLERREHETETYREEGQTYKQLFEESDQDTQTYKQLLAMSEKENDDKDFRILELEEQVKQLQDFDPLEAEDDGGGGNYVRRARYDALQTQIRIQKNKINAFEIKNRQLKEDNERLAGAAARLREIERQPVSSVSLPKNSADNDSAQSIQSVLGAVQHADKALNGVRFLPNAFDTAKSGYTKGFDDRADGFCEVFAVLDGCAKARAKGSLGQTTTKWLESRGIEYSDESEDTKRRPDCIKARTFHDPHSGQDKTMTPHIKMFRNDIRIHVHWEKPENKWLIGYIGDHLPTSSDPH